MAIHQYIQAAAFTVIGTLLSVSLVMLVRQFPWIIIIVFLVLLGTYYHLQLQRQDNETRDQKYNQQKPRETTEIRATEVGQELQKKLKYARKRNQQIVLNLHKRNKSRKRRIREETLAKQRSKLVENNFHIEKFTHSSVNIWLHLVSPTGVKLSIFKTLTQGKLEEETLKKFTVSLRLLKDKKADQDTPTPKRFEILSEYKEIVLTIEKDKRIQSLLQSLAPYIISGIITTEHIPTVRFHLNDLSLSKIFEMSQLVDCILNLDDFNEPISKIYGCISNHKSETCVCDLPECFICRSRITCTEDTKVLQCCDTYVHTVDIEIWMNEHTICPYCKSLPIELGPVIISK